MPKRKQQAKKPSLYQANQSFTVMIDGELYAPAKGDLIDSSHPLVSKNRMQFLDPADPKKYVKFGVEQATSAPGETRDVAEPESQPEEPPPAKSNKASGKAKTEPESQPKSPPAKSNVKEEA